MPVDPFVTDAKKYSRKKFYTRSTNSHDHQKSLTTMFPQDLHAAVYRMVDLVPDYRTHHDLIRDAVYHRIRELEEMIDEEMPGDTRQTLELMTVQDTVREQIQLRQQLCKGARDSFDEAYESGDADLLQQTIEAHRIMVSAMSAHVAGELLPIIEQAERDLERMRS